MHALTSVLLCSALLFVDDLSKEPQGMEPLVGIWKIVSVEVNGKSQPSDSFKDHRMICTDQGRYVVVQGDRITHGKVRLDATESPKHYDVEVTSGPSKGMKMNGICEFDGTSFRSCFPLGGNDRPSEFDSKQGSGCIVHRYGREPGDTQQAWAKTLLNDLIGTWQATSYAIDGSKASEDDMKRIQLKVDNNGRTEAINDGKVFIASTIQVGATDKDLTIDICFTSKDSEGEIALGIFKIEEDTLTICRSKPRQLRPTEFSSKPGTGHTLMSYQKQRSTAK